MKTIIAFFFSLMLIGCASNKEKPASRELQKRSTRTQGLQKQMKQFVIKDKSSIPKRKSGSYFTVWAQGYYLPDGSYFHGGEITVIDEAPSFDFQ